MWVLKEKENGEFYLTYDIDKRRNWYGRGIWEIVGPQGNSYTERCVRINAQAGYLCANDDEGNVRVLVLTE
jgi:hypothetical protein